jgi:hypothetical protein
MYRLQCGVASILVFLSAIFDEESPTATCAAAASPGPSAEPTDDAMERLTKKINHRKNILTDINLFRGGG